MTGDCSIVNGLTESVLFRFVLNELSEWIAPQFFGYSLQKVEKSIFRNETFDLSEIDHKSVDFKGQRRLL